MRSSFRPTRVAELADLVDHGHLDLPTFTAIVEEARGRNIRVVGHIPQRGEGITGSFFQPGSANLTNDAVLFLKTIKDLLEDPSRLLLQI